ncbi:hypothetical protein [Seonamhaeicola aphaedonensis]|uniref:Uncharacterized protein n=1 Tax=Seonamhaeicola aphaedonensis TaxID=1461338 RepID=A0A3D9HKH7_9FLAO|nr:hypothetical protein [Seonamhaeicola aphaedonensis]RED49989.1 hypothetical protein DFQ02_1019 [Seonamhaeicola aphaedonensis]
MKKITFFKSTRGLASYQLIAGFIILNLCLGCASFPKTQTPSICHINLNNINLIEGTYAMKHCYPDSKDSIIYKSVFNEDLNRYPTLFEEINNGILVKRLKMNSEKEYTFSLKILNLKRIEIDYLEDNLVVRKNSVRYKLKEDGFVHIKHRNFKIIGIPYVLGGINKKRTRLALFEDNNLLLEASEFESGGVFYPGFIIPAINFASKSKYKKIYQRIN